MKFQNPSLNFFEWTDAHTHGQAETNMLPTFSKLGKSEKKWIFFQKLLQPVRKLVDADN